MDNQPTRVYNSDRPVPLGVLGAFLFALVGGVVYYVLWTLGIIAALSGIICVICAIKGYEIFAGARTKRGIFISVAVSALMLVLAWYFCYCSDIHAYWEAAFAAGEAEYAPTIWECLRYGYMDLPANPGYLVDLILSLAMGGVGCWGYVTYALRRQEAVAQRRAEQNRTMELARMQAEQAERARLAEQAAEARASDETVQPPADGSEP